MNDAAIRQVIGAYYSDRIKRFGPTANGVDWRDEASQELRFAQFDCLWRDERSFSLNDLGCGYGALVDYLLARGFQPDYHGIDLSSDMVAAARTLHDDAEGARFLIGAQPDRRARFTVASGIFNVRREVARDEWHAYVLRTIHSLAEWSEAGFAFNVLSGHSDPQLQRPDLYYAHPGELLDFCGRSISRHLMLVQDYGLFEFTLIVRL